MRREATTLFEGLGDRLQQVLARLTGKGRLSDADLDSALREVRVALLEADVNFRVVKTFIQRIREGARGAEVRESLTPGQTVAGIVQRALAELLGGHTITRWLPDTSPPRPVLLMGLQGAGKTSFAQKIAFHLKNRSLRPLLVAADLRRPAAVEQLQTLGAKVGVEVFADKGARDPVALVRAAMDHARLHAFDPVLVDTSGRMEADEALMDELTRLRDLLDSPTRLMVVDAMTGQTAVDVARVFSERVGIDGVILTKMDGDARGGAALSMREVTGRPILFIATGEGPEALEVFHPDRMASRILGMGDVLSLIERAEAAYDVAGAKRQAKRLRGGDVTLEDFLEQMGAIKKMGPISDVLGMIPGLSRLKKGGIDVDDRDLKHLEAIVLSMTPEERRQPSLIDGSRRRRIARGSGTRVQDVNRLLKQFSDMRKLMKMAAGARPRGRMPPGMPPLMPRGPKG